MPARHSPNRTHLLAALPKADLERFTPRLKLIELSLGTTIYKAGSALEFAYFPTTSVVSLVSEMPNGDTAEIAIVGNEGVVGATLAMGGLRSSNHAVVQCAGHAYRVPAAEFRKELDRNGALRSLTLQYIQALMVQMAQTVACNRHHPVPQQLCRWLLLSLDRLPSNVVQMTDGLVANMLGVRLRGVMTAAGKLHAEGIITYLRGRITVQNRVKMEKRACVCYRIVRDEELRLLPQSSSALP